MSLAIFRAMQGIIYLSNTSRCVGSKMLEEDKPFNKIIVKRKGNDLSEFFSLWGFKKFEALS